MYLHTCNVLAFVCVLTKKINRNLHVNKSETIQRDYHLLLCHSSSLGVIFFLLSFLFQYFSLSCGPVPPSCCDVSPHGSWQANWLYVVCLVKERCVSLSFVYRLVVWRPSLNYYLLFNAVTCCSLFTNTCCCLLTPSVSSSCSSFLCEFFCLYMEFIFQKYWIIEGRIEGTLTSLSSIHSMVGLTFHSIPLSMYIY